MAPNVPYIHSVVNQSHTYSEENPYDQNKNIMMVCESTRTKPSLCHRHFFLCTDTMMISAQRIINQNEYKIKTREKCILEKKKYRYSIILILWMMHCSALLRMERDLSRPWQHWGWMRTLIYSWPFCLTIAIPISSLCMVLIILTIRLSFHASNITLPSWTIFRSPSFRLDMVTSLSFFGSPLCAQRVPHARVFLSRRSLYRATEL